MQSTDDSALLHQYAGNDSGEAFAILVARYINLVYSIALRQVGNPHHAEEITQAVFIILARKAGTLRHDQALSSWLFQTTRLTANNFWRSEWRRQQREQEAFMQFTLNESDNEVWPDIAPLLDDAVAGLNSKDRRAILLRFYEGRDLYEVGVALGASEDAAKKRVHRALEKLQRFFLRRGIASTTAIISAVIATNSVQAAPAALAESVTAMAIAKGATASSSTLTLIKGALKLMTWSKAKMALVAGACCLLAAGSTTLLVVQYQHGLSIAMAGQTEHPRASWTFAGYTDPPSALMSYLFVSASQADQTAFEASLTPDQQRLYEKIISRNKEVPLPHSEAETVADIFRQANKFWQDGSYCILGEQTVSVGQVVLHVRMETPKWSGNVFVKMKKIGNDWKFDGFKA